MVSVLEVGFALYHLLGHVVVSVNFVRKNYHPVTEGIDSKVMLQEFERTVRLLYESIFLIVSNF